MEDRKEFGGLDASRDVGSIADEPAPIDDPLDACSVPSLEPSALPPFLLPTLGREESFSATR